MGTRMNATLTVRDIRIDLDRIRVWRGDEVVRLTPTEYRMLVALAQNAGKVVTPEQLIMAGAQREVWDKEDAGEMVKIFIGRLRRKLGADSIENVRGFGYCIDEVAG